MEIRKAKPQDVRRYAVESCLRNIMEIQKWNGYKLKEMTSWLQEVGTMAEREVEVDNITIEKSISEFGLVTVTCNTIDGFTRPRVDLTYDMAAKLLNGFGMYKIIDEVEGDYKEFIGCE